MEYAVEIEGLSKDYEKGFLRKKSVRALDKLTLNVAPQQIFGFLGGNGAGKTTTIKTLMRLQFPTEGSAKILGRDISDVSMHGRIGYCPENPYFYDYLTATELMEYLSRLLGMRRNTRAKAEELLTRVGLEEEAWNRQLRKYSKGMLQRVALAQSLINDPEIVFLDEPMSGLDPLGRREIRELIAGFREKGTTVFMSTHILSDIEALCDEVAILNHGKLAATGHLADLLRDQSASDSLEMTVQNIDAESIRDEIELIGGAAITAKPNGATISIVDEEDIDSVLKVTRDAGGRLVSIEPVRKSLEDLFVKNATRP